MVGLSCGSNPSFVGRSLQGAICQPERYPVRCKDLYLGRLQLIIRIRSVPALQNDSQPAQGMCETQLHLLTGPHLRRGA